MCLVAAVIGVQGCGGPRRTKAQRQALISPNGAITQAADELRTGWYPNQPSLSPSVVSSGNFGRLWTRVLPLFPNEHVLAQPLVVDNTVFIATEENNLYSLDAETGAVLASRAVGPAWSSSNVACGDLDSNIGVTGTPVIDNNTKTAYFFSKEFEGAQSNVFYFAHAVDVFTLAEKPGFPVKIQGTSSNNSSLSFSAFHLFNRPALLLMNGVVYAAFGSHCDIGTYQGWVVGVSTSGQITSLFTTAVTRGNGIWMSGAGLMSDGPGRIFFSTGNGFTNNGETPQATPPADLNEAVVRLNASGGTPFAQDFFSPFNRLTLDMADNDLGSGGIVGLPPQFGTPSIPRLAVIAYKGGGMYVLNRDNLGGFKQGPSGGDAIVGSGNTAPIWGRPAVWPGDGGYIYLTGAFGGLHAYRYGLNGSGVPVFSSAGATSDAFGYSSGSPVITSDGTTSGSAVVWVNYTTGSNGPGQLRAYDAIPSGNRLTLRYSDTYANTSAKFTSPGVGNGRLYVGTAEGTVVAYGPDFAPALSAPSMNFGPVPVGTNAVQTMTITASQAVTVTSLSTSGTHFSNDAPTPALPATLAAGGTITVPIHFTPTAVAPYAGSVEVNSSSGPVSISLSGQGQANGPVLTVSPGTMLSFGGIARGTTATLNLTLSNGGSQPLVWNGFTGPSAPYAVSGLPPVGGSLAPSASVVVTLEFAPTANGMFSDTFQVQSTGGDATVFLSGSAADPGSLTITPLALDFGTVVPGGAPVTLSFTVANTGASSIVIAKSKPPSLGVFTAQTSLEEGSVVQPGQTLTEVVRFAPPGPGSFTDEWIITGGGTPAQSVTFTGVGASGSLIIGEPNVLPTPDSGNGSWMIAQQATLGQAGTLQSISMYIPEAAGNLRMGLYDASGSNQGPGVKLAETAQITPGTGWVTANVITPANLQAGTYWLAFLASSDALGQRKTDGGQAAWYPYTFGAMPGTFFDGAERASVHFSLYATLNVGPANQPPTVATPAAASPNPTAGTTTALSVLGADNGGEPNLTYTWATTGSPPAPVTFSANGNNAAKGSTATFSKVGTYNLQVTIADAQGATVTSPVVVTVNPTVTSVVVTPANPQVVVNTTRQFTATASDQFGAALATQPSFSWSVSGGGTINSSGLFTAGSTTGGPFTVTASSGGTSGSTTLTVAAAPNEPPTIVTAASASPNPVPGTSTTVSVSASDDGGPGGLTYTWSTTGSPPAPVTFFANGTGMASTTSASFTKVGSYALQVVVADQQGLTASSNVNVTVSATLTSVTVSPATTSVTVGQTRQFTATARDQFGTALASQPTFSWGTSGGGTINASGLFTAGAAAGGPFTVTASSGGQNGTASVTVTNSGPTVATAAAATPNPVTGTTSNLSVLGADDGGEAGLTYTWSAAGPAPVTFSANGSNAAKNSTATFSGAGSYTLQATIADPQALTTTSSVTVTVNATLTTVTVSPASATVAPAGTRQFTATGRDQFGTALASQPAFAWTVSGGGTINASGLFTAGATPGGPFTVTAASGGRSGTASVSVAGSGPVIIGQTNVLPQDDSGNGNWLIAQQATLSQTATLQSITFYVSVAAGGKVRLGVYDATGPNGGPGTKRAETAELTPATGGWITANVLSPVSLPAGSYWLAFLTNSDALGQRKQEGVGQAAWYPVTYGTMPPTFSPFAERATVHFSLYATLNAGPPNQTPTVATDAAANPNPIDGTTTSLTVLGADDGGEPNLTYTWATTGAPPAPVTFSPNGTNAAKSTTATFTTAGSYTFLVTITDQQGASVTSTVAVTVQSMPASVTVSPASASVAANNTAQFTGTVRDQFGAPMGAQGPYNWSVSGGGTIDSQGLFTAGASAGGPFTVSASTAGKTGTASVTVTPPANQPPTVATPASASSNPVTDTTTGLSVLGADDGGEGNLIYTWATTGTPPAPVLFFVNGSNAAKNTVVTFSKVGAYDFRVTIVDAQGLSTTSNATVTVSPTLTSVVVTPASANVVVGQSQSFTASGRDQFGATLASQPSFGWSVSGGGSINSAGQFTAGASPGGPFTVSATSGGKTGTASVTVVSAPNQGPSVATAAAATPSPTTGTTTALSVLGADDAGEANLTYSWATTGTPPAAVGFSANGSNAAKNTTATFTAVGSYSLRATITDAQGLTTTSNVTVAVNAALTTVLVSPATASVASGATATFTATGRDQFGTALASQPTFTWSVTGGGTINSAGVFSATTVGGPFTVTASSAGKSGTASVTVTGGSFSIGEPTVLPATDSGNGSWLIAQEATLAQSATVQSLRLYVPSAAGKLRLGIYDATGPNGNPGARKAETAEITPGTGWVTANVITPVVLAPGKYWLAFLAQSDSLQQRKSTDGQGKSVWYPYAYAAMPATFSTAIDGEAVRFSFTATLTP